MKDLARSRKFYEKVLGLPFKFREKDWIEFNPGQTSFALLKRRQEKGRLKPQKTRVMFQVDNLKEMVAKLKAHKVKIVGRVRKEPYGKILTFEDPNGHWLELFEPK